MTILILILFAYAVLSFVWDGILAPSIRSKLRYRLFSARDRLRCLKIEHPERLNDETFNSLHESINASIRLLPAMSFTSIFSASFALKRDDDLRQHIAKKRALLDACPLDEAREIHEGSIKVLGEALSVNSLFFVLNVLALIAPLIFPLYCGQKIGETVSELVLLPARDWDRVFGTSLKLA
jgi:hypothetical protein